MTNDRSSIVCHKSETSRLIFVNVKVNCTKPSDRFWLFNQKVGESHRTKYGFSDSVTKNTSAETTTMVAPAAMLK